MKNERRVPRISKRKPYQKPRILGRTSSRGGSILVTY